MWEGYMFGGAIAGSESVMMDRLAQTIGPERARAFRRDVQDAYLTRDDVALMARAGFNTIRLPINYRSLVTDQGCLACDGQGWRHIDDDRDHMIWLEGNQLLSDLSMFGSSFGPNVGYSTHVYTFPFDRREQRYTQAAALSQRLNAPMWIGEFGISDRNLAQAAAMMRRPGIAGWSYWSWKYVAKDAAPCDLQPPQEWLSIAPWVTGGVFRMKPTAQAVERGTEAFVRYLQHYRCTPDAAVMAALED